MRKQKRNAGTVARMCRGRFITEGQTGQRYCTYRLNVGPELAGELDQINRWIREGGYLGLWMRRLNRKTHQYGYAFANPDTAFAFKMRWM